MAECQEYIYFSGESILYIVMNYSFTYPKSCKETKKNLYKCSSSQLQRS